MRGRSPLGVTRRFGAHGKRRMTAAPTGWLGRSIERVEDAALLSGSGLYLDDLPVRVGTLHAAILRSPHAHANISTIRTGAAASAPGVAAVVTGADVKVHAASLVVGVRAPIECWPIAVDAVRYVGEPVAVVVAASRYEAEDALDLIEVDYETLPAIIDPVAAIEADAQILHQGLGSNLASDRSFRYGDPERAFAEAAHRVSVAVHYPRNSCTPMETYGVVAEYDAGADAYDVLANFQGPFSLHPVMARALKVPGNRLRLRTPPELGRQLRCQAGGVSLYRADCASRQARRPPGEVGRGPARTSRRLRLGHQPCHRAVGGRRCRRPRVRARLGSGRGRRRPYPRAGAGHALSHAWQSDRRLRHPPRRGAQPCGADQQDADRPQSRLRRAADVLRARTADAAHRRRARARSARRHPPQSGAGRCLPVSHGDRRAATIPATTSARSTSRIADGGLDDLRARQAQARAEGRLYGIGYAAVVEPSVSNMGYITTVLRR